MPTYEYQCEKCGFLFEREQSIKDEPIKKCPKCKGQVKRLISAGSGFIFKGATGAGGFTCDAGSCPLAQTGEKRCGAPSSSKFS